MGNHRLDLDTLRGWSFSFGAGDFLSISFSKSAPGGSAVVEIVFDAWEYGGMLDADEVQALLAGDLKLDYVIRATFALNKAPRKEDFIWVEETVDSVIIYE